MAAIRRWAEEFGLQDPDPVTGTVEYRGEIERIPMRVWAIAEDNAYDQLTDGRAGISRA